MSLRRRPSLDHSTIRPRVAMSADTSRLLTNSRSRAACSSESSTPRDTATQDHITLTESRDTSRKRDVVEFSPSQYQALNDQINARLDEVRARIAEIFPAVQAGCDHWYVPSELAAAAKWMAEKISQMSQDLWDKIKEALEGVAAPVTFFFYAQDWQTDVGGKASNVEGNTTAQALKAPLSWNGEAAEAYTTAVSDQSAAAAQVKANAETIATGLTWSAVSGLAFYAALAVVLFQMIQTLTAACIALGSLVFSWEGILAAVAEISVSSAAVWAAVAALSAALGTQAQQMGNVDGAAADNSSFPGGKWPTGTA